MQSLNRIMGIFSLGLMLVGIASLVTTADAFCGFYVAKADTKLFNKASKVVIARHDNKTVITMANDYEGDPNEFAMVIPVPTVLDRDQIHVTEPAIIDHLDAYTAPRLVEYFDSDPCLIVMEDRIALQTMPTPAARSNDERGAAALGVTIEAQYTVGEYDILILSAQESSGLETWLIQNGYKIPDGASPVIGSYLNKGMKFFVAKVNLKEHSKQGTTYLRPLQIAFESDHFMLPIRLGTINANGPQELFIFTLTRNGRVETANYQTQKLPSDVAIPLFVKGEFGDFYRALFDHQVDKDRMKNVYLEYAWDMGWCDPCAADPLSVAELRELGVFWQGEIANRGSKNLARDVFVTRLHVRYTADTFPNDFQFRETTDRSNFQGRYILRHTWKGERSQCEAAEQYFSGLPQRFETEAQNLASLTGWGISKIREKMASNGQSFEEKPAKKVKWYQRLWKK
ncbi:MAG: hypothetical protein ETSY2_40845 [Candidatus Entotheonella gemina]|uniref:DUF2330 domain-containing protein n=1 Tax=Candidatus Entotheonella gemina TaxID=1429439 RepID=W4LNA6_9BACT|nr:MAG: hypothetical protein ETSY2_40845 [Candidatus Entotheonella gemina]